MIVLDIALSVLLVLGCIVALVLVVPLSVPAEGAADDDDGAWWRVRVAWGFGLNALHANTNGILVQVCGLRVGARWQ